MRSRVLVLAAGLTVLLAGCGDDDRPSSAGPTATVPASVASAAQTAAIPDGLVPAATADEARDPAVLTDLRARLARAPGRLREVRSARYTIDLDLSSGTVRGSGRADFRTGESLGRLSVSSDGSTLTLDQYNDGKDTSGRPQGSATWTKDPSIVPNAPGNSTGIFARRLRIGLAGAEATLDGVRCRWAAGVVPLTELLADVRDDPSVQAFLRAAKDDAIFPIGACLSPDGLIVGLRYDVDFGRDVGLTTGPDAGQSFRGRIGFSDFGRAPAIRRPAGVPRS
ncbi:hypothetical protein [Patulibacter minatonensis]|uniref:hypothetical protein n=1 Tax=Patulibacter minatonensis TaxID=298163 RepID=UPI00047D87AD|nr:hypothetical protein [Patulibacter minatonensis]